MASRRGALAATAVACGAGAMTLPALVAPALVAAGGCAGNDCLGDTQTYGSCSEGEAVDANTWESSPVCGSYLDDHGERTWVLDPTPWMGSRVPYASAVYLSLTPDTCGDGGGSFAEAAGNLGEVNLVKGPNGWLVTVLNDTCAQYYLRVVVSYESDDAGDVGSATCRATVSP